MKPSNDQERLSVVRMLSSLGSLDLLFADLYLQRAERALAPLCGREEYLQMCRDRERLPRFAVDMRRAAQHDDWQRIRSLAEEASSLAAKISRTAELFQTADAIYGSPVLRVDAAALALSGVIVQPTAALEALQARVVDQLGVLAEGDPALGDFYRARLRHFAGLALRGADAVTAGLDTEQLRERVLAAVESGDFAAVKRLTSSIPGVAEGGSGAASRAHAPSPAKFQVAHLADPLPEGSQARAAELGLAVELLAPAPELNRYLGCPCAATPTFPTTPRKEGAPPPDGCTCGHPCPPEIGSILRDDLDFLMAHPFVSTGGLRYLPWFGAEAILVESFPETDPDARTGLLRELGLPRRRGLPRIRLEDALLRHGPRLCAQLGLDPAEFMLVCIPFDAYLRLAPRRAWGREPLWTHLDGYQVTRGLGLWALVGGNARYGGAEDLSSLARDYDSDHLTARFAVLRRQRFLVRQAADGEAAERE